jgi:hypothetical protein
MRAKNSKGWNTLKAAANAKMTVPIMEKRIMTGIRSFPGQPWSVFEADSATKIAIREVNLIDSSSGYIARLNTTNKTATIIVKIQPSLFSQFDRDAFTNTLLILHRMLYEIAPIHQMATHSSSTTILFETVSSVRR